MVVDVTVSTQDLPDLSSLQHLTELRLSNNKFKKIPFHLAKLGTTTGYLDIVVVLWIAEWL